MTTESSSEESPDTNEPLSWVKAYYTRAGEYWGPPGYSQEFFDRLAAMERLCGAGFKRVLELGAGTCETAAVMADAGHSVLALEFSPTRVPSIVTLAEQPRHRRKTLWFLLLRRLLRPSPLVRLELPG